MSRRPALITQADLARAIEAAFAAGAVRAQVQVGGIVVTAERDINGKLDVTPQGAADLDRELAEFEGRHGQN
jgi:hypothetical protein